MAKAGKLAKQLETFHDLSKGAKALDKAKDVKKASKVVDTAKDTSKASKAKVVSEYVDYSKVSKPKLLPGPDYKTPRLEAPKTKPKTDFYVGVNGATYVARDTSLTGTIKSNLGNSYDITPKKIHGVVNKNPGIKQPGIPNSSLDILNSKSELATRRYYDNKGIPYRDVDMSHHGNMKQHPEAPHEHIWECDKNGNKIWR